MQPSPAAIVHSLSCCCRGCGLRVRVFCPGRSLFASPRPPLSSLYILSSPVPSITSTWVLPCLGASLCFAEGRGELENTHTHTRTHREHSTDQKALHKHMESPPILSLERLLGGGFCLYAKRPPKIIFDPGFGGFFFSSAKKLGNTENVVNWNELKLSFPFLFASGRKKIPTNMIEKTCELHANQRCGTAFYLGGRAYLLVVFSVFFIYSFDLVEDLFA